MEKSLRITMMRKLAFLLLIFAASCNTQQPEQAVASGKDTTKKGRSTAVEAVVKNTFKHLTNKKELLGVWESEDKEPLTVDISEDSIYYTEHFESQRYQLKADSIFISYPDFMYTGRVYFNNDTLIMESEDGKAKYVKFKK